MSSQIDEQDQKLLALLAENARMSTSELGRRVGLARTTVQARLNRLESAGFIAGYTLKPGPGMLPALRATALVSIEPRSAPAVLDRLRSLPAVELVHTTSGRWDLMVQIAAHSTEELDETLDRIGEARGVKSSESLIHLATKIARSR